MRALVFKIHKYLHAVDISQVKEIIRANKIDPLLEAPYLISYIKDVPLVLINLDEVLTLREEELIKNSMENLLKERDEDNII